MTIRTILGILMLILATSPGEFAQNNAEKSGESKLVFAIEPLKEIYTQGEHIEFTFRLTNRSEKRVLVAKTFQLAHFVTLDIVTPEGKHADWCGRIVSQTDFPRTFVTLSPGQSISNKLTVSCVNQADRSRAWGYGFSSPGKYVVVGTYRLPQPEGDFKRMFPGVPAERGPVLSEPITIEIR